MRIAKKESHEGGQRQQRQRQQPIAEKKRRRRQNDRHNYEWNSVTNHFLTRCSKTLSLAQAFTPGKRVEKKNISLLQEVVGKRFLRVLRASVVLLFLSNFNTETRRSRSLHGEISFFPTDSFRRLSEKPRSGEMFTEHQAELRSGSSARSATEQLSPINGLPG